MRKYSTAAALVGLASVLLGLGAADAKPQARTAPKCFLTRNWSGWKATPDYKSIYIRVGAGDVYRLDLRDSCTALQDAGAYLVTRQHGSSWICDPLDLDLSVHNPSGGMIHCGVNSLTPLSAEQTAALPSHLKP